MSSKQNKIVVETILNGNAKKFNFNSELFECNDRSEKNFLESDSELTEKDKAFIDHIMDITGVESFYPDRYSITVSIAVAFDWDDIQKEIVNSISSHLGWEVTDVVVSEGEQKPNGINERLFMDGYGDDETTSSGNAAPFFAALALCKYIMDSSSEEEKE